MRAGQRVQLTARARFARTSNGAISRGKHLGPLHVAPYIACVCGRVVQASEPLRYAFVDGLAFIQRRAESGALRHPPQPQDRRAHARSVALGADPAAVQVAPSLRSTIPLPDTSSDTKLNLEVSATARNVNKKQVSTVASSRCSGLQASPGPLVGPAKKSPRV